MGEFMASFEASRPLLATLAGVLGLLVLILYRKVPAFPALLVAAIFTGLAAGLSPDAVIEAISTGMGGVLGFIAVIVGLGALLGAFLEASGAAQALAGAIIGRRTPQLSSIAMGVVGIILAIPVFFDVGLILLFPLVMALAKKAKKPTLFFGLPLLAGLAAAHAFIPPTPGPVAVAEILGAELGLVILFGLLAGVPAMLVAGPAYALYAEKKGWLADRLVIIGDQDEPVKVDKALAARALIAIAIPIILIMLAAFGKFTGLSADAFGDIIGFVGHPFVALLIACALSYYLFKPQDDSQ